MRWSRCADKWRAFGWEAAVVDGHDPRQLIQALESGASRPDRPLAIIANTVKGQGISYMCDQAGWHHGVPNAEQYRQALAELDAEAQR